MFVRHGDTTRVLPVAQNCCLGAALCSLVILLASFLEGQVKASASTDRLLYRTASFLGCAWLVNMTGFLVFIVFQAKAGWSGDGGPEQYSV